MFAALTAAMALAVAMGIGVMMLDSFQRDAIIATVVEAITPKPVPLPALSGEELYERVAPSVVKVVVKDENGEPFAFGSGFFIDESIIAKSHPWLEADGQDATELRMPTSRGQRTRTATLEEVFHLDTRQRYVLTNYHVMRPAKSAEIVLFNGDKGAVSWVIAENEEADLALISVSVPVSHPVTAIPLAERDPRVLSTVYAFGSPKGLQGSASEGKVSAYRKLEGEALWLQTTAPISPGSSGGPLVLSDGTVVGVTTMGRIDGQNLNFAIPASEVLEFLSSTSYQRREVAEGAEIAQHENLPRDAQSRFEVAQSRFDLAYARFSAGEVAESIALFESTLELIDFSDLSQRTLFYAAHYHLGIAHRTIGNFEEAIRIFTKAKSTGLSEGAWDEEIAKCKRGER
jgi:S1-C subfamily serine protease